jgi:hypothetical protein
MEAEENEEIKSSCRTTKTILHGDPFIKDYIYKQESKTTSQPRSQARGEKPYHIHFSLTNAHWQVTCGRKMAASRSEKLIKVMELQPAIDLLSLSALLQGVYQHRIPLFTSTTDWRPWRP